MTVDLHHFRVCPHSLTVRWGLTHKRVPHRLHDAGLLLRPDLKRISGQPWPPVLVDGSTVRAHLGPCTRYLDEEWPAHPLLPSAPVARAEHRLLSHWAERALHYLVVAVKYLNPGNRAAARRSILDGRLDNTWLDRLLAWLSPWVQAFRVRQVSYYRSELPELQRALRECWAALDDRLRTRPLLAGDALTWVDLQVYANLTTLHGCEEAEDAGGFPRLRAWLRRIEGEYAWPHS